MKIEMSRAEFVNYMLNIKGTRPIGILAVTQDKDQNKNEFTKISRIGGLTGFNYSNSVNRAQGTEDFVAGPLPWGKHIGGAVIEHKGKFYIQCKVQSTRKPIYIMRGKIGRPLLKIRSNPEHGVIVRSYKVESIARCNIDGKQITLVP